MSTRETESEIIGFRLSPQQQRALEQGDASAVVQCATFVGAPDTEALRRALSDAVKRHEVLRTTFIRPVGVRDRQQVIQDELAAGWREETVPDAALGDPAAVGELLARERAEAFDVETGPLVRALLLAPQAGRGLLVLTAHAACADLHSLLLLCDELIAPVGEQSEPIQYADYAEWRHEFIASDEPVAEDGRAWWRSLSAEPHSAPRLPFGAPDASGGELSVPVPVALSPAALTAAAEAQRVTPAVVLQASWHTVLARLTGEADVVVADWLDGRDQPDLEHAIGAYSQPAPIRSHIGPATSFAEMVDQVRRGRVEAARRQDYASAADHAALAQSALAGFVEIDVAKRPVAAICPPQTAPLLLVCRIDADGGLSAEIQFDGAAVRPEDAQSLARRLSTLIGSAAGDASRSVSRLAILEPSEREQLIAAASGPAGPETATAVHDLFDLQADRTPELPAVAGARSELSYSDLRAAANRLANMLQEAGVGRSDRVGLCLERTPALLEAVLGILKAGGAYVPLNYEHPQARLAHQLRETEARALVTEAHLLDRLPPIDGAVICLDRDRQRIDAYPASAPDQVSRPDDLAYVMYTSGSTGQPKGVAITHGNLANYSVQFAERLGAEGSRFGVVSAISTDLGNTGIFPALLSGGCVHLISPEGSMDGDALAAELDGVALDVVKIAPSHLRALLAAGAHWLPRRWLVIGGEALSWELVQQIRELAQSCRVLNHYGPTETTIGCCAYDVAEQRTDAATVPIGRPIAGLRAYVLNRELEPVPTGVPGELCVAGAGVAAGYLGRSAEDDQPSSPFLADPLGPEPTPMYRTGDRVRTLEDGAIEFLGRIDDQVKIRGFRIEPGEVEAVLARHSAVRQAAVVPEPDERGELRLVAYISASGEPTVEDLQAFLAESLPDYMIPSTFATLSALPFTPSGKIDRRALATAATSQMRRGARYVAPRDEIEERIAGIWSELLGVEEVGVFDDFFALGGHSLLATQAIMRIRRDHAEVPLRALLAAPTVAALAEVVRGGPIADAGSAPSP